MTASASPAAGAATAALAAPSGQPASAPLTRVALAYIEPRFKLYLRFGDPARTLQLDRWRRCAVFLPGAMFCRIRWQANTLIVWDNRFLQHCGIHDYENERRHLVRTTVAGERPI